MSEKKTMWMVRAGEGAMLFNDFKEKSVIAIGWNKIGDLTNVKDYEEIKELTEKAYGEYKKGKINISAGQIGRFRLDFEKGDKIITYDPEERIYLVGEIQTDYEFISLIEGFPHVRRVKWLGKVDRDKLSTSTKNTLGAISTIFEINEDAEKEIMNLLYGKEEQIEDREEQDEKLDSLREDLLSKAHEFIKDKILNLDWEEMQELIAGILGAMGYKSIISQRGSDRGKDIIASPDGLGLQEPRIKVEVKHRSGQMSSKEIRSFITVLRLGNKGIYVSTGGFSKEAKYEAERSDKPLTLIDLDMLANLVVQHYDNFDINTRQLIPLVKVYWPD